MRRHSLCAGLLPLICGVCRAVKPDAASERTARLQPTLTLTPTLALTLALALPLPLTLPLTLTLTLTR